MSHGIAYILLLYVCLRHVPIGVVVLTCTRRLAGSDAPRSCRNIPVSILEEISYPRFVELSSKVFSARTIYDHLTKVASALLSKDNETVNGEGMDAGY